MQALSLGRLSFGLLAGLTLVLGPQPGWAVNKQEIKFDTFDKVELHGTFYGSAKGATASCVILVHKIGGDRTKGGWDDLAQALQAKDFAVLSFDLRGHGDSTGVDKDAFWKVPANSQFVVARRDKTTISYKDFRPGYSPMLANDLVAAKNFLDQQNNARLCNSSNVIVIGAEDGGALAALWMYSAWLDERNYVKDALGRIILGKQPMGEDISAAVFLSTSTSFSGAKVLTWLEGTTQYPIREKVPMYFMYSKDDTKGETAALYFEKTLKAGGGPKTKMNFTGHKIVGTKEVGAALLGPPVKAEDKIVEYLDQVMQEKAASAWTNHEVPPDLFPMPLSRYGFTSLR